MPSRCGFVERKLQNNDSIGVEVDSWISHIGHRLNWLTCLHLNNF